MCVDLASQIIQIAQVESISIATAESCTGGLVGGALTEISGASDVYMGGFITYVNQLKQELLGVSFETIEKYTAVSGEVAEEMALGCREKTGAQVALSVTGLAGPGGGSKAIPVGTVWFGVATRKGVDTYHWVFEGGRADIRNQAVCMALELILKALRS